MHQGSEKLGRSVYAMDVDPIYAAVALRRWEAFTGRTAKRVARGRPQRRARRRS